MIPKLHRHSGDKTSLPKVNKGTSCKRSLGEELINYREKSYNVKSYVFMVGKDILKSESYWETIK